MRIGILHSYQLSGSGSCVYVRSLGLALAKRSHEVHVISLEPEPSRFPEVWLAYEHRDGARRELFRRTREDGGFVSHTLAAEWQPIAYPRAEVDPARSPLFTSLTDPQMKDYLDGLLERIDEIVFAEGLEVLHANHMGPKAVVAARIRRRRGIPYVVTVHGTFFEYVVSRDRRFVAWAEEGLVNADAVIALNEDVKRRILAVTPGIEDRIAIVPVGVDLERFAPLPPGRERQRAAHVCASIEETSSGGLHDETRARLHAAAGGALSGEAVARLVEEARRAYDPTRADRGAAERLRRIDWARTRTVVYLGKLLADKGIHCLLAAAPHFLTRHPEAQLLVVGSGPLREDLELLVGAIHHRNPSRIGALLGAGRPGGGERIGDAPAAPARDLGAPPERWLDRVVFCGYLTTAQIALLLPLCTVCVVPSLVPEAFPLVVLEAASSGVLPMGTPAGGLREVLGRVQAAVGPLPTVLVDADADRLVDELGEKVAAALDSLTDEANARAVRQKCRRFAEDGFSWDSVAGRIEAILAQLPRAARPAAG